MKCPTPFSGEKIGKLSSRCHLLKCRVHKVKEVHVALPLIQEGQLSVSGEDCAQY